MIMSITEKDLSIVKNWFEPYHYGTISMLEKVFYKHQTYSYNILIKRLQQLIKADYIKAVKDESSNRTIYIYNIPKVLLPTEHQMMLLDFLSEIKYLGFNVEYFKIEKRWMEVENRKIEGKFRSDGFIQFTVDSLNDEKGKRYYFCIEFQKSNNYINLEKYDEIFESGEIQKFVGRDKEFFPKILLISDRHYSNIKFKHPQIKLLQINLELDSLASIIL